MLAGGVWIVFTIALLKEAYGRGISVTENNTGQSIESIIFRFMISLIIAVVFIIIGLSFSKISDRKRRGYITDKEAKKAIEMFNGQDHEGRKMIVNEARPQKD